MGPAYFSGTNKVEINGESYEKKINVINLKSMSGHMQHDELLDYYSGINCREIYLVHGNGDRPIFKESLEKSYYDKFKTTKVIIPKRKDVVEY